MRYLTPSQLSEWLGDGSRTKPLLLDVREPWEFQLCHLEGSVHVPMAAIPLRKDELDPAQETVVICHHGARSFQAASYLERNGFDNLYNLESGIDGWARTVDPAMAKY
ncbi:MAG: sulfurtransferase [Betaproteobacteria bacterium]|nr:sulfurtransferase [Betaproteobacteria bacterium]